MVLKVEVELIVQVNYVERNYHFEYNLIAHTCFVVMITRNKLACDS